MPATHTCQLHASVARCRRVTAMAAAAATCMHAVHNAITASACGWSDAPWGPSTCCGMRHASALAANLFANMSACALAQGGVSMLAYDAYACLYCAAMLDRSRCMMYESMRIFRPSPSKSHPHSVKAQQEIQRFRSALHLSALIPSSPCSCASSPCRGPGSSIW